MSALCGRTESQGQETQSSRPQSKLTCMEPAPFFPKASGALCRVEVVFPLDSWYQLPQIRWGGQATEIKASRMVTLGSSYLTELRCLSPTVQLAHFLPFLLLRLGMPLSETHAPAIPYTQKSSPMNLTPASDRIRIRSRKGASSGMEVHLLSCSSQAPASMFPPHPHVSSGSA